MDGPRVALGPAELDPFVQAIRRGGGAVSSAPDADAVLWLDPGDPEGLRTMLDGSPARWVQLPFAGIEDFFTAGVIDDSRTWTCTKGDAYGPACAELALALIGMAARSIHVHAADRLWWKGDATTHRRIAGTTAVIVGTGGIGQSLASMLAPLRVRVIGVNRSGRPLPGAERTVTDLASVVGEADWLVVAAAFTSETRHLVDRKILEAMKPNSWIVNVARGGLVDTEALVDVVRSGTIGGAALDVTDPEPLPEDHPLWKMPNVVITSHTANTVPMAIPELAALVERNVRKFAAGEPLEGLVDVKLGY